jgi:hypothetical protein
MCGSWINWDVLDVGQSRAAEESKLRFCRRSEFKIKADRERHDQFVEKVLSLESEQKSPVLRLWATPVALECSGDNLFQQSYFGLSVHKFISVPLDFTRVHLEPLADSMAHSRPLRFLLVSGMVATQGHWKSPIPIGLFEPSRLPATDLYRPETNFFFHFLNKGQSLPTCQRSEPWVFRFQLNFFRWFFM